MSPQKATVVAGMFLGFFVGSSMGLAFGGTAYNAAWFTTPLGAFIGWILTSRTPSQTPNEPISQNGNQETDATFADKVALVFQSLLKIMASIWNFHIDLLDMLKVLPTFVKQPLLFLGLCIVLTIIFPPFFMIYFFAWLGANHFDLDEENQYRAKIP